MESSLDAFHVRIARKLTGRQPRRGRYGGWFYSSLVEAIKEAVIVRIWTWILRRQNTAAQFIATQPIMDLCKKAERRPGARVPRRWWDQTGIEWKGAREKSEATEDTAEPAMTGTDSESEADTPVGTVRGTGEEALLGESDSSGAEWSRAEE